MKSLITLLCTLSHLPFLLLKGHGSVKIYPGKAPATAIGAAAMIGATTTGATGSGIITGIGATASGII